MIDLIIRPAAEADYRRALMWYDDEQPGLGDKFLEDLRNTIARIREMPLQFPDIGGARRGLFHTFPYAIYFILTGPDRGFVLAIVHQHRRPSTWKRRLLSWNRGST